MKKLLFVAAAVSIVSRSAAAEWTPPTRVDAALLAFNEALIVVDMAQTVRMCNDRFNVTCESGLLLLTAGNHPSTEQIMAWGAASMVLTAALWYVLPDEWRKTHMITQGVLEGLNVGINVGRGAGLGFVF